MSPMTLPRLLLAASAVALLGGCSILGSGDKSPGFTPFIRPPCR